MSWRLVFRCLRTSETATSTLPNPIPRLSFTTTPLGRMIPKTTRKKFIIYKKKGKKHRKKTRPYMTTRIRNGLFEVIIKRDKSLMIPSFETVVERNKSLMTPTFEAILERDKSFNLFVRSKDYFSSRPGRVIPLDDTAKCCQAIGIPYSDKVNRFLHDHPLIFDTFRHSDNRIWLGFSSLMDNLLEEESRIREVMELDRVSRVRKLLMMTLQKRVHLTKLHRFRQVFGLPCDFHSRVLKYPKFFRVVAENGGRFLELTNIDSSLAVSALERDLVVDKEKVEETFKFEVKNGEDSGKVSTLPLVSPYSDGSKLDHGTVESEKYQLGVLHEFLSLTLEKRASSRHILQFKNEFGLKGNLYFMQKKQPWTFYLVGTELKWEVFLKDAYDKDGVLIKKDPQVVFNEKMYKYATKQSLYEL